MKFIIILLLFPIISIAQDVNKIRVDSLLKAISLQKNDRLKVDLYRDICKEYELKDLNKLIHYNNKIYELSNKINYTRGKGFYFYHLSSIHKAQGKDIVYSSKKAVEIFSKIKDTNNLIVAKYTLAHVLTDQKNYFEAKKVIGESLELLKTNTDYKQTARFYALLGIINYFEGTLHSSLKNYKKSLYFHHKNNSSLEDKSQLYLYMAFTLTDLERNQESLYYLNLTQKNQIDINIEKATVLNKLKRHDEALELLLDNKSSNIYKTKDLEYYNQYVLAETYYNLKKYNVAIKYLKEIYKVQGNLELTIRYYNLLSKCYLKLNELENAKLYISKALIMVDSSQLPNSKMDVFLTTSKIDEKTNNYFEAFIYYKKHALLKEENYEKNKEDRISELQIDFDVAEKNNSIKNLKILQLEKDNKISNQRNFIILICIVLFVLFLSFFIFIKINKLLKQKNAIIESNNLQLVASIKEKEILLKEIHHRVKNNLQLVMSLLYIQSKEKGINMDDFIEISQSRIISMALIHENLYQTNDLCKVDFSEYINNLIESIGANYNNFRNEIQLEANVEQVYLDIQKAIPLGLIINELISNAYKHGFINSNKGKIIIQLKQLDCNFELIVKDDGIGISNKQSSNKTLGLELVKQLTAQINGVLEVNNNSGTEYKILFKATSI